MLDMHVWRQLKSYKSAEIVSTSPRICANSAGREPEGSTLLTWSQVNSIRSAALQECPVGESFVFTVSPDGTEGRQLDYDAHFIRRRSKTLIVVLHGALQRAKYVPPRFEYMRTLSSRTESLLFLADPTINVHPDLALGWYVGTEIDHGHQAISELIIAASKAAAASKIIIVGSSGGGFAALAASHRIPGSLALVFSPQTAIQSYHRGYASKLSTLAFPRDGQDISTLSAHIDRFDMNHLYSGDDARNRVLYVQNTGDQFHLTRHCLPFMSTLGASFSSGELANDRYRFEFCYLREGHGGAKPDVMNRYLDAASSWLESSA